MASINRYQTINDIPASKGKDVLLKILNSPKADFSKLQKIAVEYEKKALSLKAGKSLLCFLLFCFHHFKSLSFIFNSNFL